MVRALWFGLIAVVLFADAVRADIPGPGPRPPRPPFDRNPLPNPVPDPAPQLGPPPEDPITGKQLWNTQEEKKPKRTGPFRSCGSGMGAGLAGIGLAWGVLWLGGRFVRSQRSAATRVR